MIYDILKNSDSYFQHSDRMAKAVDFITTFDAATPDGRYELDGEMYAVVMSYKTKPAEQQKSETHKKYIDVQAILNGRERIDVAILSDSIAVDTPYDEAKDAAFYRMPDEHIPLIMTEGTFAVFYPQDVHRPCCDLDCVADVRKIVVKVPLV
jgi:YhcH/YjgK/YiaL family protein